MNNSRLKNSSYNVFFNILQLLVTTILTFVTRTFFIRYLGKEMLGLDGLFTNILSMLSLTELGIGTAISFSLYKPLAEGDYEKVSCLMTLYKKMYRIIAIVILVIGLLLLPILPIISKGYTGGSLYLYYLVYLVNTVFSYLLTYKGPLITADQHEYKLFWNQLLFTVVMYVLQIVVLIKVKSFMYYLLVMLITNFLRNLINNIYITKLYKNIDFSKNQKVDKQTINTITQNVKNMFISRIGDYLLNGTDNIIISAIDITLTGIYSNYLAIVGVMKTLINAIYNGVTASFGNVMAIEKQDVQENVFKISTFICFLISGLITLELIFLFNPFIRLWAGKDYLVSFKLSIVIALNFYFYSNHISLNSLKMASGHYKADRYVAIIQAIVNLAVSIVLGYYIGLSGVILGTLVSYLTVGFIFRPLLLIKSIFNKSAFEYFFEQAKYGMTLLVVFIINYILYRYINLDTNIITILFKGSIVAIIYFVIVSILFNQNKSFKYLIGLIKNKISRE